ncbi:helix-turn-helix domain-containing protein [Martelella alba]|uniref:Helix-turn-helix domain-containing protein n=1 Tax=Martelella alba TaxID=2590451 RepID=A0ABY2SQJ7_9HYPH|nr:helix-turn-helix domain-containing protein [Martelella alba]
MQENRVRISLLFNANKTYDRQVIEGIGEYFQVSQCNWDIYIEEDFSVHAFDQDMLSSRGIIADFDDGELARHLSRLPIPVVGVGGSYHNPADYPSVHYVATDNEALVSSALDHLVGKGLSRFAFYGLPDTAGKNWARERLSAFRRLTDGRGYTAFTYEGLVTQSGVWDTAQRNLAEWLMSLPVNTGIIAVTDARARHILQVCEQINIAVPENLCVVGIDDEVLTRCLSRISLSSVVQGARKMGYEAARLLDRLLWRQDVPASPIIIPPEGVIGRRSTDYRSLIDPMVIRAMHFIRGNACKGIKVEHVLGVLGVSRSNIEQKFIAETGMTLHKAIQEERLGKAMDLLATTSIPITEISRLCSYNTPQYFYAIFRRKTGVTPLKYRIDRLYGNHGMQ